MAVLVLLDTNFMMVPSQFRVDIFTELQRLCSFQYKIAVIEETVEELENIIQKQKGKEQKAAELALQLIREKGIQVISSQAKTKTLKNADQLILALAEQGNTVVATQDRLLRDQLRAKNIPVIVVRQKNHLEYAA